MATLFAIFREFTMFNKDVLSYVIDGTSPASLQHLSNSLLIGEPAA